MKTRPRPAILALVAVAALSLTACGASPEPFVGSDSAPATVTETATATVTAPAPKPEVQVKEVTPQSCIIALDAMVQVADAAGGYVQLIPEAAQAGSVGSTAQIQQITEKMAELNAQVDEANADMGGNAQECRALAK